MGFESALLLKEHEEDKSEPETSQVVSCESTVTEEVKKSLSQEPFLLVRMENEGGTKSVDTVCDPEFFEDDVAEAVTPRADVPELTIAGPEEVACVPKKKVIRGEEVLSLRQLNFESGDYQVKRLSFDSDDAEEEDQYLLVLENMILDLIMPDGFLDWQEKIETTPIDLSPHEICKTPDSKHCNYMPRCSYEAIS